MIDSVVHMVGDWVVLFNKHSLTISFMMWLQVGIHGLYAFSEIRNGGSSVPPPTVHSKIEC